MMITEAELARRKRRIILAALDNFCRYGIENVSISDIARTAEVSEASIYRYFNTKRQLVIQATMGLWEAIIEKFLAPAQGEGYQAKTGLEQVAVLLKSFDTIIKDHQEEVLFSYDCKLYLVHHEVDTPFREVKPILGPIHQAFIAAITKGQADGSIAAVQPPEHLYLALWGMVRGYVGKIAIADRLQIQKNWWKEQLPLVRRIVLTALRHGVIEEP